MKIRVALLALVIVVSSVDVALAAQRCGAGMKRDPAHAWRDKQGVVHGPCIPKHHPHP